MSRKLCGFVLVVLMASVGLANANSVTFTDSIPLMDTNWNQVVTLPKFDPSLGTLDSITFLLEAQTQGTAQYENQDGAPATISLTLQAVVTLQRPDLSPIVLIVPTVDVMDNASAFDGIINFDGPSGGSFSNLVGSASDMTITPPPVSDLALFTATFAGETISLPVTAMGASSGSGAGNLIQQFSMQASAEVTVIYDFSVAPSAVPEPSTLSLLAGGSILLGLGLRRYRTKRSV